MRMLSCLHERQTLACCASRLHHAKTSRACLKNHFWAHWAGLAAFMAVAAKLEDSCTWTDELRTDSKVHRCLPAFGKKPDHLQLIDALLLLLLMGSVAALASLEALRPLQ